MQVTTHGHGDTSLVEKELRSRTLYSRLIGALFLAGFLLYGSGSLLVDSITGEPDFVSTIPEQETALVLGAFLMLLNTGVDVGKGVLFFPILEGHGKRTALVYLAALIVQVVFLDIGVLFLLMLVPLGELAVEGGGASPEFATGLASLLTDSNTISYNIGQAVLSFGGVFLCWLLFRTGLIPRALAALGVVGYVLHGVGSIAEIFGIPIGLILLIPGGIFELGLAFWLLIKGFQPEAYAEGFRSPVSASRPRPG
ncbi:MAG: DUF4386 domain-containing protein [Actinomycetota bacterium]|nr:DUF4386 domain-containing protein [Actinomycetota bacterium]